jgi:phosphotransferase system HPr (HPr) family protein
MPEISLRVIDPAGLHGRPAARFVQIASRFQSAVTLGAGGRTANAKSMVGLLGLAVRPQSEITISAEGDDADAALAALLAELGPTVEPTERGPVMPP